MQTIAGKRHKSSEDLYLLKYPKIRKIKKKKVSAEIETMNLTEK